jgi:hypothetical protein
VARAKDKDFLACSDAAGSRINSGAMLFRSSEWSSKLLKAWWNSIEETPRPNVKPLYRMGSELVADQEVFDYMWGAKVMNVSQRTRIIPEDSFNR